MKTIYKLSLLFTLSIAINLVSAQNHYRTVGSDVWTNVAIWENDNNGDGNFTASVAAPVNTDGTITIRSGHTVSIGASMTISEVVVVGTLTVNATFNLTLSGVNAISISSGGIVNNNGTLTIGNSNPSLNIASGGTLNNSSVIAQNISTGRIIHISGTYNQLQGGTFSGAASSENVFQSGSTYNHDYTTSNGTIITGTWNSGSTCVVRGFTTNATPPGGLGQNFHHFTWNLTNLNLGGSQIELIGLPSTINGDYRVTSTGNNGDGIILNSVAAGSSTINVAGAFEVTGSSTLFLTLDENGTTTINCATLTVNNASSTLDFGLGNATINATGNVTLSAGNVTEGAASDANINELVFTGTSTQQYVSGATIDQRIDFEIADNAIVNLASNNFLGGSSCGGTFTLQDLGTLRTAHTSSSGAIQASNSSGAVQFASRSYIDGATVILNGSSAQFLGSGTPSNVNVTIDNSSGVTLAGNVTIGANRTLTFTSGKLALSTRTLTITGSVSGMSATNSFTGSSSSNITIGGTAGGSAGTLFFDQTTPGTTNNIQNFTLSRTGGGSVTLGNALIMSRFLSITNGTFTTGGFLTMQSNATQTAEIGNIGGTLSGNVTVQRFIPSVGRRFRFLASPVSGISFASSWQLATHITGAGGAANGFDATTSNNASCYTYTEATAGASSIGWTSIANTGSTNLTPGIGYRMLIRGSRTSGRLDGTDATQDAITLSATGTHATGTQTLTLGCSNTCAADDGWHLRGNPFQATIDWDLVGRTNVDNAIYIFRPATNSYAEYVSGVGSNGGSDKISPGQAFFVHASNSTSSIAIEEADKTTFGNANDLFKTEEIIPNLLRVSLTDGSLTNITSDIVVRYRDTASNNFDSEFDAHRLTHNSNGNISSHDGITYYAINTRDINYLNNANLDTVNLKITLPATAGNYKLLFTSQETFEAGKYIYLKDNFSNTLTQINSLSEFAFSVSTNPLTIGQNRFQLIFSTTQQALPVSIINFSAKKDGRKAILKWTTSSEKNSAMFVIERSFDAKTFVTIGTTKAIGNSSALTNYTYNDITPALNQTNYYRLKMVDKDGSFAYSAIQIVNYLDGLTANTQLVTKVYPVPAKNQISASFGNELKGNVTFNILDVMGNEIMAEQVVNADLQNEVNINLPASLTSGIYFITFTDEYGNAQRVKFTKE